MGTVGTFPIIYGVIFMSEVSKSLTKLVDGKPRFII